MKISLLVLFGVIPLAVTFAQENYEPGVILLQVRQPGIVRFSNGRVLDGSTQLQAVLLQFPSTGSRKLSHVDAATDGWYRLEFPDTLSLVAVHAAFTACTDIANVTFNYYGYLCGEPNDPQWGSQWALSKIQLPNAWEITKSNGSILVGVLDTGIDYNHVDLSDNIWTNPNEIAGNGIDDDGNGRIDDIRGWDFFDSDNDPQDGGTHGTKDRRCYSSENL